jgi:uncharacterized protein YciI
MYLLNLTYLTPLAVVDSHLAAHKAYLDSLYLAGKVLMSGRKEPRTGGVMVLLTDSPDEAQALMEADPFHTHGVASYELTRFTVGKAVPQLSAYLSVPAR